MNNIQQILKDLLAHYQKCWFPALTINKNLDLSVGLPSQSSSVPFAFLDSTSGNFLFAQTSPFRTSFRQICWQYLLSFVVDTFASYKILTCKLYSFSSCHHFFFQLTVCIIISVLRIMTVFPFCFFFFIIFLFVFGFLILQYAIGSFSFILAFVLFDVYRVSRNRNLISWNNFRKVSAKISQNILSNPFYFLCFSGLQLFICESVLPRLLYLLWSFLLFYSRVFLSLISLISNDQFCNPFFSYI